MVDAKYAMHTVKYVSWSFFCQPSYISQVLWDILFSLSKVVVVLIIPFISADTLEMKRNVQVQPSCTENTDVSETDNSSLELPEKR